MKKSIEINIEKSLNNENYQAADFKNQDGK